MASNLQEMREEILEFIKRPLTDDYWIKTANSAINNALKTLQHKIPDFNALEVIDNSIIYPANSVTINPADSNSNDINKIISAQVLHKEGDYTGRPLHVLDYTALTQNMYNFEQKNSPLSLDYPEYDTYKSYISCTQNHILYLLGTDIGLYPIPTSDIRLAIHYTRYLPSLIQDSDTNVLLENCPEYIFYFSLRRLNVLLSELDRITVSSAILEEALADARAWNSSLTYSNHIDL